MGSLGMLVVYIVLLVQDSINLPEKAILLHY